MRKNRMHWKARMLVFKMIFFIILTMAVMFLWNNVLIDLFSLSTISFWQAMGLLLFARILTGNVGPGRFSQGGSFRHGKGMMHQQWKNMGDDYKKHWMDKMRKGDRETIEDQS